MFSAFSNVDDDVCETTPMCNSIGKRTPAMLRSDDSLECQFCTKVINSAIWIQ